MIPLIAWALVTTVISSGNWNDSSIWLSDNIGDNIDKDVEFNNNLPGAVTIQNSDSYEIGTLDMNNGNILVIDSGGSLIIGSNIINKNLFGGNMITVNANGNLEIWGDLTLSNDLVINIEGSVTIHGDFNGGNDADVTVDGTLIIDGNADLGNNSVLVGLGAVNIGGDCNGPDSFCLNGPLDTVPPVISDCPADTVVNIDTGCEVIVNWVEPTADDGFYSLVDTFTSTHSSGDLFPVGITNVIYTATDLYDNSSTCEFTITVNDIAPPVFESCATDIIITELDLNAQSAIVTWQEPIVSDNCPTSIIISSNFSSGDRFPLGRTEVTYTAIDASGNSATCKFSITIEENTIPVGDKAFTPNNDNINDVWVIENIENYPDNHVMIFDRLGGVIYSATGYNNRDIAWDGRSNQSGLDKMPTGTYFYKIDLGNGISTPKGFVELIR